MAPQQLPDEEIQFLNSRPHPPTMRLAALHSLGWSLSTLSKALNPPRPKSTVHKWIQDEEFFDMQSPIPAPHKPLQTRSISPLVPPRIAQELPEIARLARFCRSRTPHSSPFYQANQKFTEICLDLHSKGVPVKAIAHSARVSERAIFRRIEKGLNK